MPAHLLAALSNLYSWSPPTDAGRGNAARRTSVLVFFEERIQQRDQGCEIETEFIRSKVRVEEHTGELGVSCTQ